MAHGNYSDRTVVTSFTNIEGPFSYVTCMFEIELIELRGKSECSTFYYIPNWRLVHACFVCEHDESPI